MDDIKFTTSGTKRAGWIEQLNALYERLQAAGFRVQGTRLDLYRKTFLTIDKFIAEKREQELQRKVGTATHVNDVHESGELLEACNEFPDLTQAGLRERLQKALNGPKELEKETPEKGGPRNFLFELVMAALLKRAGFSIDLARTEDVFFQLAGRPVFMECKRIHSSSRLEKRIEDAALQIGKRCDEARTNKARGIIAIDVSKLLTSGDRFYPALTLEDLVSACINLLQTFLGMHNRRLEGVSSKERRVLGLHIYSRLPGLILQPLSINTCRYSHFLFLHDKRSKDAALGEMFVRRIRPAAMRIQ